MKLLLLRSSYSRKAEELLWKRGFYDIIQRCKQRGDVSVCVHVHEREGIPTPLGRKEGW